MKEVRWTETARKSLRELSIFLLEMWNTQIHDGFLDQLDYRIEQLRRNPELGPRFENSHFRRLLIHKSVSLFYTNEPEYIKLLLVWDNRLDPDKLLEKLSK